MDLYVWDKDGMDYYCNHEKVTAVPVVKMGGLTPAFYITSDESEADGFIVFTEDLPEGAE